MTNFICKYCSKECKNYNSLINHERLCKLNPNRQLSPFIELNKKRSLGIIPGENQYTKAKRLGLVKPIVSDITRKKLSEKSSNKKLTEQTKNKISESRKKYLNEHPDKIPFKLNHSSKISYPEQYFIDLFKNENIPLKYHLQVSRYELDFYNEDLMKYVEIDGEQHYSESMIEHDKIRTEFLENLGWKGIRIRWSTYQKSSDNDKQQIINQIKKFINLI